MATAIKSSLLGNVAILVLFITIQVADTASVRDISGDREHLNTNHRSNDAEEVGADDFRRKRSIDYLPSDARPLQSIGSLDIVVYGSRSGAFVKVGRYEFVHRVHGIDGPVTDCIVGDRFSKQDYTVYLQVRSDARTFEYYSLKPGHMTAERIVGLPDDATFAAIFDHSGVILFRSSLGTYQVPQGGVHATKIGDGYVIRISITGMNAMASDVDRPGNGELSSTIPMQRQGESTTEAAVEATTAVSGESSYTTSEAVTSTTTTERVINERNAEPTTEMVTESNADTTTTTTEHSNNEDLDTTTLAVTEPNEEQSETTTEAAAANRHDEETTPVTTTEETSTATTLTTESDRIPDNAELLTYVKFTWVHRSGSDIYILWHRKGECYNDYKCFECTKIAGIDGAVLKAYVYPDIDRILFRVRGNRFYVLDVGEANATAIANLPDGAVVLYRRDDRAIYFESSHTGAQYKVDGHSAKLVE